MYKNASRFMQGSKGGSHAQSGSVWEREQGGVLRYLVDNSAPCGATHFVHSFDDWHLARLMVKLRDTELLQNEWFNSIMEDVSERLQRHGASVRLTTYHRRVAETVIPELINRARRAEETQ